MPRASLTQPPAPARANSMAEHESGCSYCNKSFDELGLDTYLTEVNPSGGYGRNQVLICDTCLELPINVETKERLKEQANEPVH